jgi:hypothetical protein
MTRLATLRVYLILHKAWSRASLILAFSFDLVASTQNSQSLVPQQSVSYAVRQSRGQLRVEPQRRQDIPLEMAAPPSFRNSTPVATIQPVAMSMPWFLEEPQYPKGKARRPQQLPTSITTAKWTWR